MSTFIVIKEKENGGGYKILIDDNNKNIDLCTITEQFMDIIGLKYKSETGGYNIITIVDGKLIQPKGGWKSNEYIIIKKKGYINVYIDFKKYL